jgi:hypothetical protein
MPNVQQVLPFGGDFEHDVTVEHAFREAMQLNDERGFTKVIMLFEDAKGNQCYRSNVNDPMWQAYVLHRCLKDAVD